MQGEKSADVHSVVAAHKKYHACACMQSVGSKQSNLDRRGPSLQSRWSPIHDISRAGIGRSFGSILRGSIREGIMANLRIASCVLRYTILLQLWPISATPPTPHYSNSRGLRFRPCLRWILQLVTFDRSRGLGVVTNFGGRMIVSSWVG